MLASRLLQSRKEAFKCVDNVPVDGHRFKISRVFCTVGKRFMSRDGLRHGVQGDTVEKLTFNGLCRRAWQQVEQSGLFLSTLKALETST